MAMDFQHDLDEEFNPDNEELNDMSTVMSSSDAANLSYSSAKENFQQLTPVVPAGRPGN